MEKWVCNRFIGYRAFLTPKCLWEHVILTDFGTFSTIYGRFRGFIPPGGGVFTIVELYIWT